MTALLWAGTMLGAVVGFFHALQVLQSRMGRPGLDPVKTIWQAVWTWGLWTLFGAYVLTFWILGLICFGISRALRSGRGAA